MNHLRNTLHTTYNTKTRLLLSLNILGDSVRPLSQIAAFIFRIKFSLCQFYSGDAANVLVRLDREIRVAVVTLVLFLLI